jgi:hypothetical protein
MTRRTGVVRRYGDGATVAAAAVPRPVAEPTPRRWDCWLAIDTNRYTIAPNAVHFDKVTDIYYATSIEGFDNYTEDGWPMLTRAFIPWDGVYEITWQSMWPIFGEHPTDRATRGYSTIQLAGDPRQRRMPFTWANEENSVAITVTRPMVRGTEIGLEWLGNFTDIVLENGWSSYFYITYRCGYVDHVGRWR